VTRACLGAGEVGLLEAVGERGEVEGEPAQFVPQFLLQRAVGALRAMVVFLPAGRLGRVEPRTLGTCPCSARDI
jgi:hypothetical protein